MLNLWRLAWPYFFIVAVGIVLYFKVLFFELTFLDDNVWLLDYHWFLKDPKNAVKFFTHPDLISNVFYRPVLNLSFMFNALFGGQEPTYYHALNIVFHLTNGILLYSLLQKLNYSKQLSLSFSVLFVTHPVLVSAVAWIPGRTDSLLCIFVLSTFILFLKYIETRSVLFLIAHFLFYILGLLTKETAIALPIICFVYLFWVDDRKVEGKIKALLVVSWTVLTLVWLYLRKIILTGAKTVDIEIATQSFIKNSPAFVSYIGKIFLPFNLSVLPILKDTVLTYGIISLVCLIIFIFLSKQKRNKYLVFGVLWFFIFLAPSLIISFLKHEYRLYVPIIGCVILILEILGHKRQMQRVSLVLTIGVILFFSVIAHKHIGHYQNRYTFWENAVETSPHSPLAHRNLGAMYYLDNRMAEAEEEFLKARDLNPKEAMVHNNLGLIYRLKGDNVAAERAFKQEIAINPKYENVYANLAILYFDLGRFKEAEKLWLKTIELEPKYIDAYKRLAVLYYNQMEYDKSATYFQFLKDQGIPIPAQMIQTLNLK